MNYFMGRDNTLRYIPPPNEGRLITTIKSVKHSIYPICKNFGKNLIAAVQQANRPEHFIVQACSLLVSG